MTLLRSYYSLLFKIFETNLFTTPSFLSIDCLIKFLLQISKSILSNPIYTPIPKQYIYITLLVKVITFQTFFQVITYFKLSTISKNLRIRNNVSRNFPAVIIPRNNSLQKFASPLQIAGESSMGMMAPSSINFHPFNHRR